LDKEGQGWFDNPDYHPALWPPLLPEVGASKRNRRGGTRGRYEKLYMEQRQSNQALQIFYLNACC